MIRITGKDYSVRGPPLKKRAGHFAPDSARGQPHTAPLRARHKSTLARPPTLRKPCLLG